MNKKYYFNQWPMKELSTIFDVYVNNKSWNGSININDILKINGYEYKVLNIIDNNLITKALPAPIKS